MNNTCTIYINPDCDKPVLITRPNSAVVPYAKFLSAKVILTVHLGQAQGCELRRNTYDPNHVDRTILPDELIAWFDLEPTHLTALLLGIVPMKLMSQLLYEDYIC